jgi:hypothetical protein
VNESCNAIPARLSVAPANTCRTCWRGRVGSARDEMRHDKSASRE